MSPSKKPSEAAEKPFPKLSQEAFERMAGKVKEHLKPARAYKRQSGVAKNTDNTAFQTYLADLKPAPKKKPKK